MCFHKSNILHTRLGCVPSLHGCGSLLSWSVFSKSIKLFPPLTYSTILFILVNNTFCFSWLSILKHLFFSYFTSCGDINIHHIHICNDYLCLNNNLNLCYWHKFPMKHFMHFNKFWTIYHFMSIETTNLCHAYEEVFCDF